MFIKFHARFNGEIWCATAEGEDIFAIGESIVELMNNVDIAARLHFSGKIPPGEELHIMIANDAAAPASA